MSLPQKAAPVRISAYFPAFVDITSPCTFLLYKSPSVLSAPLHITLVALLQIHTSSQSHSPSSVPPQPPFPTMVWPLIDEHSATMLGGWMPFLSIPKLVFAWWRRLVWVWEHLPVLWGALQLIWRVLRALWEVWRMAKRGPKAWTLCVFFPDVLWRRPRVSIVAN